MKIIIVGLGLIGGSIAKALRKSGNHEILAIDLNGKSLEAAVEQNAIDREAEFSDIKDADIIYLCVYPEAATNFVREHINDFKQDCIVTDTCGIKREICNDMAEIKKENDFTFVAGHPMAGKEKSGFSASDSAIFNGASYIIIEDENKVAVNKVADLAREMGFAEIVMTTAQKHDQIISFTSQLPHVLACAYVLSPRSREHKGFSAGSYRDVSRVANINAELWTSLFLDNADDLVDEIDILIKNLETMKNHIQNDEADKLEKILDEASQIKRNDGTVN